MPNPLFKGSFDYDDTAKDLLQVTKSIKTKLLFISLFLQQLKPGGRRACIVPDGVLFGSSKAHQELMKTIVKGQKLDAAISMPSGVFKPYASVTLVIVAVLCDLQAGNGILAVTIILLIISIPSSCYRLADLLIAGFMDRGSSVRYSELIAGIKIPALWRG